MEEICSVIFFASKQDDIIGTQAIKLSLFFEQTVNPVLTGLHIVTFLHIRFLHITCSTNKIRVILKYILYFISIIVTIQLRRL